MWHGEHTTITVLRCVWCSAQRRNTGRCAAGCLAISCVRCARHAGSTCATRADAGTGSTDGRGSP